MAQFYKGLKANLPTTYEESAYYQTIDTGELFFAVSKTQLVKIGGSGDDKGKELVILHLPDVVKPGNVIVKNNADGSVLFTIPYEGEDIGFRVDDGVDYSVECPSADGYIFVPIHRTAIGNTTRKISTIYNSAANGIYIGYTDGATSPYNELIPNKIPEGIVVRSDNMTILLHPSDDFHKQWSEDFTTQIPGVTTTTEKSIAIQDFAGKANTDVVFAAGKAGSAFEWARSFGDEWYLPACGEMDEIFKQKDEINPALILIGSRTQITDMMEYLTSTQYSASDNWYLEPQGPAWDHRIKNNGYGVVRAVRAFLY